MLSIKRLSSLNLLSDRLKSEYNMNKTTFYAGKILETTAETCFNTCPYSVVAVLFTEQSFSNYGERLTTELKRKELSPVNVICSKNEMQEISRVARSLPENVRLIVTVDSEHIYNAQALAKELCAECVIGLTSLPKKLFDNAVSPPTAFVLDEKLSIDRGETYELIVSRIVSLLDIKLKQFFKIIPKNCLVTDEFVQILDDALFCNENELLQFVIELELYERALRHTVTPYGIKTSLSIIKLLADNLTKSYFCVPDYIARAKAVSELYGKSYLETLEGFKEQLDRQKRASDNLKDIRKGLSALAKVYLEKRERIIAKFSSFNGQCEKGAKITKEILQTLKYAGDIHYYNNSMSLLRETGYLERI